MTWSIYIHLLNLIIKPVVPCYDKTHATWTTAGALPSDACPRIKNRSIKTSTQLKIQLWSIVRLWNGEFIRSVLHFFLRKYFTHDLLASQFCTMTWSAAVAHQSVAIDGCREVLYKNRTENAIRVVVLFFFLPKSGPNHTHTSALLNNFFSKRRSNPQAPQHWCDAHIQIYYLFRSGL